MMRIGDILTQEQQRDIPHSSEEHPLQEGADGSGNEVRKQLGLPENSEKRRKHFLKPENNAAFTFEKDRLYEGDFFNPYIDFSSMYKKYSTKNQKAKDIAEFSLKLPGFSIKVIKYINDKTHNLRYVFKNNETKEVYFVVVITLLYGEELQQALREEDERSRNASRDASIIAVDTQDEVQDDFPDSTHSPLQEFHDAKAFAVLGADS
jgi:hypothetical protein